MHFLKYISKPEVIANYLVIDLRANAHRQGSELRDAILFPVKNRSDLVGSAVFDLQKGLLKKIKKIEPNRPIVLFCHDGGIRSKTAWEIIRTERDCFIYKNGIKGLKRGIYQTLNLEYNLFALTGPTGSGKTEMLHLISKSGMQTLDLEGLANHAGSIFGNLHEKAQPSQLQFDLDLASTLLKHDSGLPILVESEQPNLGSVIIPRSFWLQIQSATPVYMVSGIASRVERLIKTYANKNDSALANAIVQLDIKIGKENVANLLEALRTRNYAKVAKALIDYYDNTDGYLNKVPTQADLVFDTDDFAKAANEIELALKEKVPASREL